MPEDKADQAAPPAGAPPEGKSKHAEAGAPASALPAAGPHAKPSLTDPAKTPGSGTLPDPEQPQDGDATTG